MCVPRHANNSCGPLFTGLLNQSSSSSYAQIRLACEDDIQVTGDMLDAVASPNDPLFIFHHTNVDRHFTLWTARMDSLRINTTLAAESYYSFPTDSACNGCNLADVISAVSPFMRSIFEPYEEKTILQTPTVSAASLRRRRKFQPMAFRRLALFLNRTTTTTFRCLTTMTMSVLITLTLQLKTSLI